MSKRLSFSIAVNLLTENFKKGARTVKDSFRAMQMQVITFAAALGAGGLGLSGLISRFRTVARETNQVMTALKNVSDGTRGFANSLDFLNGLAKKYGIYINTLAGNFTKFTASATQANMSMDDQKKVFEAVSRATSAFALSTEQTDGVFLALSQMMGKGKISSEELRKQMGEKLPIAMQAMAKAAGVSMGELEKLLKQGQLMSADIIPKFADALNEMIPNVNTDNLETSLNRLKNSFAEIVNASGFQNKYKALVDGLNSLLQSASKNMQSVITGVVAAIGFVVMAGLTKTYGKYNATRKQIIANATATSKTLRQLTLARVEAKKTLNNLELQHDQATGAQKIRLARQVDLQQRRLASATTAVNKARLNAQAAAEKAAALKTVAWWKTTKLAVTGTLMKIGAAAKAMWASFGPAVVISGLIALGGQLLNIYNKTQRLKKATKEYNAEVKAEQINIDILFDRLRRAQKGTEDYERAKATIQSKYGEYLAGLTKEQKALEDVEGAYKAISAAALQSARDRAMAAFSEQAVGDYTKVWGEQIGAIGKKLSKKYEPVEADKLLDDIKNAIDQGTISPELQKRIDAVGKTFTSTGGGGGHWVNEVQQGVNIMLSAKARMDKDQAAAKKVWGTPSAPPSPSGDNANPGIKTYAEQVREAKSEVASLKQELQSLLSGKTPSADYAKDIADKTTALKEAEEKLSYLTTGKSSSGGSSDDKALRAAEKRLEASRKLDEADRLRQIEKQKFDLDIQQKTIDAMDDSFEKRMRQTLLNLDKEKLAIEEHQSKLLKDQLEYAKDQYVSKHGDTKGFEAHFADLQKAGFKGSDGASLLPEGLRPEDIAAEVGILLAAAQEAQRKGLADINKDLSAFIQDQQNMFASDLDKRLAELDTYYDQQLVKAKGNAEAIALIEANRKRETTQAKTDDKLNKLDFQEQLEQERMAGLESIGMTELVEEKKLEITRKYLQLRIDALQALADAGDENAQQQIQSLQASLDRLDTQKPAKGLKTMADQAVFNLIVNGFKRMGNSADEAEAKTIALLSNIRKRAGAIADSVALLQSAFGGLDEGLDNAMAAVGNIAQGFASGGIVGGMISIVGEGLKIFSHSKKINREHREAVRLLNLQREQQQHLYELTKAQERLEYEKGNTIYGSDEWGKASNAAGEYAKNQKELEASLQKLSDVDIVTGSKKTGALWWKKRKDTYSSILDIYDDLIDAEGNLNKSRAESILSTHKMSDESKQALQQAIDNAEMVEAAYAEMKNYLTDIFGDLGNTIMDTFVEAFKGSKDAMADFADSASDMLADIVTGFIQSIRLAPILEKASAEAEKIMDNSKLSDEEKNKKLVEVTGSLIKDAMNAQGAINADLEYWGKEIKKQTGVNPFEEKAGSQDSTKGYSTTMDQDTGGAILGRVTGIHESLLQVISMASAASIDTSIISAQSVAIGNEQKKQTGILYEMQQMQMKSFRRLEDINEKMDVFKDMQSSLDTISKNTKGL